MEARQIIDALENKYGSSRSAAQAIQVDFVRYLEWILEPHTMPRQVKERLSVMAGLTRPVMEVRHAA